MVTYIPRAFGGTIVIGGSQGNVNNGGNIPTVVLFPLPAPVIPFAGTGSVLPVLVPPLLPYTASGTVLDSQPYLCTAPAATTALIPAGSTFVLLFSSPTGNTTSLLATGSSVTLRFGLANGASATGQVQVVSTTIGTIFQVQCTLTQDLHLIAS